MDKICKSIRLKTLDVLYKSQASHLGTSMSCVEILVAIYSLLDCDKIISKKNDRCRVFVSKGHAAASTYAVMNYFGLITDEELNTYHLDGSNLCGHVSHAVDCVEHSTGALGHGMPVAVGSAIGLKNQNFKNSRSIAICGDGELQEGSIWEALMLAAHCNLDNFCLIIDYNKISSITSTNSVSNLEPLKKKFESFSCICKIADGHDVFKIKKTIKMNMFKKKPLVVICNTVKGKDVPFAENQPIWHYRSLDKKLYEEAKRYLNSYEK